jgi:hypothetical protein
MEFLNPFSGVGKPLGGESFPNPPIRVPYPNPHPTDKDGCFPAPPKVPKQPMPKGPMRHPKKSPAPRRRGG